MFTGTMKLLRLLPLRRPGAFFLLAWLLLLVGNHAVLTNPPYWDDIMGLHNQALWLSEHRFDVIRLLTQEKDFWNGGVKIHPLGIMSHVYGLLYLAFPPVAVHFIGHCLNLGCIAAAFTAVLRLLLVTTGTANAWLWGLAALSMPVMAGRMAESGQESPLLLIVVLSITCFLRGRFLTAVVLAAGSFFIKETGIILLLAYAVYWLLYNLAETLIRKRKAKRWGLFAVNIALLAVLMAAMLLCDQASLNIAQAPLFILFQRLLNHILFFFPTSAAIYLLGFITLAILFLRGKLRRYLLPALLLIFITGFTTAYSRHFVPIPRYTAVVVFPLCLMAALSLPRRWSPWVAAVTLLLQLPNFDGRWFPSLPEFQSRHGSSLERSREFVADLQDNLDVCRFLEKNCADAPIVAKWPWVQMLTRPEMGYVSRPLSQVYSAGMPVPQYFPARKIGSPADLPSHAIYIYSPTSFRQWPDLRPQKEDRILFVSSRLQPPVVVYRR